MDAASLDLWPTPNCWIQSLCCRTAWPFRGALGRQEWANTLSSRHPALAWAGQCPAGYQLSWGEEAPAEQEGKAEHSSSGSKPALHWSCCLCSCSGLPRISSHTALVHLHLDSVSSFVSHSSQRIWEHWVCSEKGQALSMSSEDRLSAHGLFGEQKIKAGSCTACKEPAEEMEPGSLLWQEAEEQEKMARLTRRRLWLEINN